MPTFWGTARRCSASASRRRARLPPSHTEPRPTQSYAELPQFRVTPQGEVDPTFTDALVDSMKAPVRVADVNVGGCRRGPLRSGEQRLAFDPGEELGGSDLEFQ